MTAIAHTLLSLEQRVYDPAVRRSEELLAALFAEDFLEFGSSGKVFDKASTIEALRNEPPFAGTLKIEDFEAVTLAEGLALVTYRLVASDSSGKPVRVTLRSSIWREADGKWQLRFHQGTVVGIWNYEFRI